MSAIPKDGESGLRAILGHVDWPLVLIVGFISAMGLLNLHSAAQAADKSWHLVQAVALLVGGGLMGLTCAVDYRAYHRWSYIIYGAVVFLLVAVLAVGTELNGSKRWLDLGVFLMQPSELLKIAVILVTARFFDDRARDDSYSLLGLRRIFGIVAGGVVFVLLQPDLGTSLVILAIFMTMVLFEGVRGTSLAALGLAAVLAMPIVWNFGMKEYQKARVVSFLNLEEDQYGQAWQVRQSIIAFGSGRVWGKGHREGTQIQKGFVPESENDFIAANWAEEHGFAGMLVLLAAYMALILWALHISARARDRFGAHLGVGVAAMIFWHVVVNIAMVTGMLPVVGLTLPLMSYGRSSLMASMLGLGLLLNVSMRRRGPVLG
jgi:rod shape determining protein RodA